MPKAFITHKQKTFMQTVGADIRAMRMQADVSQETVGEIFGWNRDAISKIEAGINTVSLYEYLQIVLFFREISPDHPALDVAKKYALRS